jgi:hypothetical protein
MKSISCFHIPTSLLWIINSIMNEEQLFGIAKHKLTVVAIDATYTKQITTDYLMISPGRYEYTKKGGEKARYECTICS